MASSRLRWKTMKSRNRNLPWHIAIALAMLSNLPAMHLSSVAFAEVEGAIQLGNEFGPCTITDGAPGIRTVYVYHTFTAGTIGSRFRLASGTGMSMTYVSETHFVPTTGNVVDGLAACYGSCQAPVLIAKVQYIGYGTSSSCSQINIVPYPGEDAVEGLRCDGVPVSLVSRDIFVGPTPGNCGCPDGKLYIGTPRTFNCQPVALRSSTWGAVKALYRE